MSKRLPAALVVAVFLLQSVTCSVRAGDSAPVPSPDPLGLKPLSPKVAPTSDNTAKSTGSAAPTDTGFRPGSATTSNGAATKPATTGSPGTKAAAAGATSTKPVTAASGTTSSKPVTAATGTPATKPATSTAKPASGTKAEQPKAAVPPTAPSIEKFNQVGELEKLMFGVAQPNIPIEYRLDRLESEVFHQTNPEWDAKRRIDRLSHTLMGGPSAASTAAAPPPTTEPAPGAENPYLPELPTTMRNMPLDGAPVQQHSVIPIPDLSKAEYQKPLSRDDLEQFALDVVNDARYQVGLPPLQWDKLAHQIARAQIADLCKRNALSHQNAAGENPDVRYTKAGGTDCLVESLVSLKPKGQLVPNKALVYNILKEMASHQDDHDTLMNKFATDFAFAFDRNSAQDKLIACAETLTKQAEVSTIPAEVHVGDKVEVKGVLKGPYKFQKITVAWEGTPPPDESEDSEEALPYFPPLDYEAFARKSEHDWQKAQTLLRLGGMGLALAGGVFIPPVALAAPLIAATGANAKPKAVSEIPVHGGVHVDGPLFEFKTPLTKDNKEGIYYITVWALSEVDQAPFAVSRRAVIAKPAELTPTAQEQPTPSVADNKTAQNKTGQK